MNSPSRTTPSTSGNDPWNTFFNEFPAIAGKMMKIALKTTIATPTAQPIAFSETCSSSGTCWFADQVSARYPRPSDSPRPITPRTIGMLR